MSRPKHKPLSDRAAIPVREEALGVLSIEVEASKEPRG